MSKEADRGNEREEREKPPPAVAQQPDERRWWELQLGFALPKGLYTESPTGR